MLWFLQLNKKLKSTERRTNKSEEPRNIRGSETVHNATMWLCFCKERLNLAKHFLQSINNVWASSVALRKCKCSFTTHVVRTVAYPGILFGGSSTNSVADRGQRERGSGGGSPLVRGSGGSCNLVQEVSFHMVKFLNFWYFSLFMTTTSLFVIANVKQLRT